MDHAWGLQRGETVCPNLLQHQLRDVTKAHAYQCPTLLHCGILVTALNALGRGLVGNSRLFFRLVKLLETFVEPQCHPHLDEPQSIIQPQLAHHSFSDGWFARCRRQLRRFWPGAETFGHGGCVHVAVTPHHGYHGSCHALMCAEDRPGTVQRHAGTSPCTDAVALPGWACYKAVSQQVLGRPLMTRTVHDRARYRIGTDMAAMHCAGDKPGGARLAGQHLFPLLPLRPDQAQGRWRLPLRRP